MNLRPGQIVTLAAGVVLVIFSFFTFYGIESSDGFDADALKEQCKELDDFDTSGLTDSQREQFDTAKSACSLADGASAWNTDLSLPLATWPAIIGLVVAGLMAATTFGNLDPPEVAGFSFPQLLVGLSTSGALIMLGHLIRGTEDGQTLGIGFWFMLIGSIALLAGTVMELLQGPRPANAALGGPGYGSPQTFGDPQGYGGPPPAGGPQGPPPGPPGSGGYQPPGPPPPGQPGAF